MCHATQIRSDHSDYQRHFRAPVDHAAFAHAYEQGLRDPSMRIPRAIDEAFRRQPWAQDSITQLIDAYEASRRQDFEQALFAERRIANGGSDSTTGMRGRIASRRIHNLLAAFGDARSSPQDAYVYRSDVAPVAIWKDDGARMMPMRYQTYPRSGSSAYRHRTCLKEVFGIRHGLLLADAFLEHPVRRDDTGSDEIPQGDREAQGQALRFSPLSAEPMLLACVWRPATADDALPGFTILMDLPPPEVSHAGVDRCVIPIDPQYVERWLRPHGDVQQAEEILKARVRPYFESEKLAA